LVVFDLPGVPVSAYLCGRALHEAFAQCKCTRSHGAAIATTAWTYQRLVGIMDIVGD